jgi:hypothetical protein
MIGRIRSMENALATGRALATADPSLSDQDRGRQAAVLNELARGDQILGGIDGVLLPVVAPASYLQHSTGTLPQPVAGDPASAVLEAGEGTVRALQTADGVRAILGGNPATASEAQQHMAAALVVSQPQGAAEAALLRELLAERGLANIPGTERPHVDMFDIYAGVIGGLVAGPAGEAVLPAYLENSGAKQVAKDIIASVYWSPTHAPEVFGEWWEDVKEDWPAIVGTLVGFLAAEVLAAVLLASPHPAAQLAGAAIQAALLALVAFAAGLQVMKLIGAVMSWLTLCRDAGGDPAKIHVASKAFCHVMLDAVLALLAVLGARSTRLGHQRLSSRLASGPAENVAAADGAAGGPVPAAARGDTALRQRLRDLKRVDDPERVAESLRKDELFRQRKIDNEELRADPDTLAHDLERGGVSRERYNQMLNGDAAHEGERLPLGFRSYEQFHQFKAELVDTVAKTRVDGKPIGARVKQIGTGTQFYSGNPDKPLGHHWDRKGPGLGDLDIEVTSPEMARHMLGLPSPALNEGVLVGGERQIFRSGGARVPGSFYEQFPQFQRLASKWSQILGREVDFKLKMDIDALESETARGGGPGPVVLYGDEQ